MTFATFGHLAAILSTMGHFNQQKNTEAVYGTFRLKFYSTCLSSCALNGSGLWSIVYTPINQRRKWVLLVQPTFAGSVVSI